MTEKEKMLAGLWYNSNTAELNEDRKRARKIFKEINKLSDEDKPKRTALDKIGSFQLFCQRSLHFKTQWCNTRLPHSTAQWRNS